MKNGVKLAIKQRNTGAANWVGYEQHRTDRFINRGYRSLACGVAAMNIADIRSIVYPGQHMSDPPYAHTLGMLQFKAAVVMQEADCLTGWALAYRKHIGDALIRRAWILHQEDGGEW